MMKVTKEVRAVAAQARNAEYTRSKAAGEPRDEDREFSAGLEATFAYVASQPQPVAQGEAIGEVRENGVNWYGPNPHAFPMGTKFYTSAPAIPIGHRVVPEIMTAAMINAWSGGITVTSDAIALRTNFQKGWARVLAAASPSDGGV